MRLLCNRVSGFILAAFLLVGGMSPVHTQFQAKWMTVGSLHSWFANTGCEREVALSSTQQNGLQWPAIYLYQDCQAAKGFWIGTTNFIDSSFSPPITFPYKVVHVGPRVDGTTEFFPTRFEMVSRFDPPIVTVDGAVSESGKTADVEGKDTTLKADRMIINDVNTALGITMRRKILGFSQQFHDNYFIYEYTFKNTGKTGSDDIVRLHRTLNGLYFYYQYRYAVSRDARYVIANSAGWGINTMNDSRGDGLNPSAPFFPPARWTQYNDIRAQYAWHGKHPTPNTPPPYDNIGAPVWNPPQSRFETFSDRTDTSGRLTAPQFVGVATLYADSSAQVHRDDLRQPSTTSYEGSDDPLNFNNSQFNPGPMTAEYQWMSKGHQTPRHADKVGPTGDPSQGYATANTSGGQSCANGYGPYTLAPGDSVVIVMAEAVAGLSREKAISVGIRYKNGEKYGKTYPEGITAAQKNDSVYSGRDSLFQTFRRAIANFRAGYNIPQPPYPPKDLTVASGGDKITLSWGVYGEGPAITGFRLYRATGKYDGEYSLVAELPPNARSYNDVEPNVARGVANYYYAVALGNPPPAGVDPLLARPGVPLVSSRYYAQTYDPAFLKRAAGPALGARVEENTNMSKIRVVPNPYIISAYMKAGDKNSLRFQGEKDKLAFYNVPGYCKIYIYSELGELIYTINHTDGSGDAYWNSITDAKQVVVSGVYIAIIEDSKTGGRAIRKFVVIR